MFKTRHYIFSLLATAALGTGIVSSVYVAEPKYKADVPNSILTPDEVETRLGTLRFIDGAPDDKTVELAYDNLDFMRGVEAFLDGIPAASLYAMCKGFGDAGVGPQAYGIFETLMDARSLLLTANSSTVYVTHCFDLEDGPIVLEASPGLLGPLDDAYSRNIIDVGFTGPDLDCLHRMTLNVRSLISEA